MKFLDNLRDRRLLKKLTLASDSTARDGFTLIEVVISLTVFLIFVGIIMKSFIYLLSVQIEANRYRKVYAEVEQVVRLLRSDARNLAIDYSLPLDRQGVIQELRFISGDKLIKSTYTLTFPTNDEDEITLRRVEEDRSNLNVSFTVKSETDLSFKAGILTNINLVALPKDDPFKNDPFAGTRTTGLLQQPRVQVMMSVVPRSYPNGSPFFMQTTLSSRFYDSTSALN